jgi:uncharacterized membrane protein
MTRTTRGSRTEINLGQTERFVSNIAGLLLIGSSLRRLSLFRLPLLLGGTYLLYRGTTGKDPVYDLIGIERTTRDQPAGIMGTVSVTINRPRDEVYRYFRDFENLPNFMRHLESVRVEGQGIGSHSFWEAAAPLNTLITWEAEMTADQENEHIAWRTLPNQLIFHQGDVRFADAPGGRGTEIFVNIMYRVPGGSAGAAFAAAFGKEPQMQIRSELGRLKQMMEAGETATVTGQASGRNQVVEEEREKLHPQP